MNEILQAQRGVVAIEDRARFGIAPHIAVVADRLVLPRGTHNLEPFAPTITLGDRGSPPAPPLVPVRFPSGQLRVTVRVPDGTTRTFGPSAFRQDLLRGSTRSNGFSMEGGGHEKYELLT